jgi:hypothetical protein
MLKAGVSCAVESYASMKVRLACIGLRRVIDLDAGSSFAWKGEYECALSCRQQVAEEGYCQSPDA